MVYEEINELTDLYIGVDSYTDEELVLKYEFTNENDLLLFMQTLNKELNIRSGIGLVEVVKAVENGDCTSVTINIEYDEDTNITAIKNFMTTIESIQT